ncbi:MAG: alkaline phosphatase family protein [Pseudomonadota bacterium]
MMRRWLGLWLAAWCCGTAWAEDLPRPDHIVIVVEENRTYAQVIGNPEAPYINALAQRGALLTQSHGVSYPSQPNYLALFSGSMHGVRDDACPYALHGPNLAHALQEAGRSFVSYSESLPYPGYDDCSAPGGYRRKHNPVANWAELAKLNQPFSAFPQDFAQLPSVALVVPNQRNDMHDGSIATADGWLKQHLAAYADWVMTHNSLLIVTWDEDDYHSGNHIPTLLVGPMVRAGVQSAQPVNHYNILRTVLDMAGAQPVGASADAQALGGIWRSVQEKAE